MLRLELPTIAETHNAVGGLSEPSKMPWWGFSTPASACKTGSKLRTVPGSVCHGCYAHKGNYAYDNVQRSLANRLRILRRNPTRWSRLMVRAIVARASRFVPTRAVPHPAFRWHDSGDLQGVWHLHAIAAVCSATMRVAYADGTTGPVLHWLPSREYGFITEYFEGGGAYPPNLTIRLSAHMIDGPVPERLAARWGLAISSVHTDAGVYPEASVCPASTQGNQCLDCRNCWDPNIHHVSYHKH